MLLSKKKTQAAKLNTHLGSEVPCYCRDEVFFGCAGRSLTKFVELAVPLQRGGLHEYSMRIIHGPCISRGWSDDIWLIV